MFGVAAEAEAMLDSRVEAAQGPPQGPTPAPAGNTQSDPSLGQRAKFLRELLLLSLVCPLVASPP